MRWTAAASRGLAILAVFAGIGCSESAGPPTLTGSWLYSAPNLTSNGVQCSVYATLDLKQSGADFSGTYKGASVSCNAPFGRGWGLSGAVLSGSLVGDTVAFDLDSPTYHHVGEWTGSRMSGTASAIIVVTGPVGSITITGDWSARKQ